VGDGNGPEEEEEERPPSLPGARRPAINTRNREDKDMAIWRQILAGEDESRRCRRPECRWIPGTRAHGGTHARESLDSTQGRWFGEAGSLTMGSERETRDRPISILATALTSYWRRRFGESR
jgi:hypothetical protein